MKLLDNTRISVKWQAILLGLILASCFAVRVWTIGAPAPDRTAWKEIDYIYISQNYWNHGLLDAHEVLCQWKPDPNLLLEKAENWKATHVLHVLLSNCKHLMNSPVPDRLLNQLKPRPIKKWAGKKILSSPELLECTNKSGKYRVLQLASQTFLPDSFSRSLRFLLHYFKTALIR